MKLLLLPPFEVENCWDVLSKLIEKAMPYSHGELATEDVLSCVKRETMFVFVNEGFTQVFVVEFIHYPRKRSMNIVVAAGRGAFETLNDQLEQFKEIARTGGASSIEARSRVSVARLGRMKTGSTPSYVVSVLEV